MKNHALVFPVMWPCIVRIALFLTISTSCILNLSACASLPDFAQTLSLGTFPSAVTPNVRGPNGLLSGEESLSLIRNMNPGTKRADILEKHIALMENVSGTLLFAGNRVKLLIDRPKIYSAMLQAVAGARDHINIEIFALRRDGFGLILAEALLKKRAEGVQVNLIYDSIGSWGTPSDFFKKLKAGGIQVLEFNPVYPLKARGLWSPLRRDHRKALIVDGKVALIGSANIGSANIESPAGGGPGKAAPVPYRDTAVRIEGPAVAELQRLFLETWRKQCGPLLYGRSYFPALDKEGDDLVYIAGSTAGVGKRATYLMYLSMLTFAERSVHLTNAYFAPDRQLVNALCDAASRGVEVRIILPSMSDHSMVRRAGKFYYARLLRSGVKLYERRNAFLHAKTAVVDGFCSTVGSTNMDMWSAARNDELNVVILSREFASQMEDLFARDLEKSTPVVLKDWERRALGSRLSEWFWQLLIPWL